MKKLVYLTMCYIVTIVCLIAMSSLTSCSSKKSMVKYNVDKCPVWANNIKNPNNAEFVEECAFNLKINSAAVTQQNFDERYLLTN